jgi:hypothetical protein
MARATSIASHSSFGVALIGKGMPHPCPGLAVPLTKRNVNTASLVGFHMTGDQKRRATAQYLIKIREVRHESFPSELFDEHAWNMLLHLFVAMANNDVMTEAAMVQLSGASHSVGRRWLGHLLADERIEDRVEGDDIILTASSVSSMRLFLDRAHDLYVSPRQ